MEDNQDMREGNSRAWGETKPDTQGATITKHHKHKIYWENSTKRVDTLQRTLGHPAQTVISKQKQIS